MTQDTPSRDGAPEPGPAALPGTPLSRAGLTGERTMPGVWHERYWLARHEAAYELVARALADGSARRRWVVDAGCGEGYGSARLARDGVRVLALDLDPLVPPHVRTTYAVDGSGVHAARANLVQLPVADAAADAVVALQVLEHLWDQAAFVRECLRVVRPGGQVWLSTPNRATFPAGNPFHARELDASELAALLATSRAPVRLRGLAHGPRLRAWEAEHGDLVGAQLAAPPDAWENALASLVTSTTAGDFVWQDAERAGLAGCLDLVAQLQRPATA